MMYISKIQLRPDAEDRREYWRLIKESYQIHSLIWDLFGDDPEQKRDFLFRVEMGKKLPSFLVVSNREPVNRYDVWDIVSKRYEPCLNAGQRFSFVLRANPVRKKRDENKRQHRHDVVMESKFRLKNEDVSRDKWPSDAEIVQAAGYVWLAARADQYGFAIREQDIISDGYLQHSFRKPKGNYAVKYSTIEYSGILTINNPELFLSALYSGIGPEKGFGCGLLLIKPLRVE